MNNNAKTAKAFFLWSMLQRKKGDVNNTYTLLAALQPA